MITGYSGMEKIERCRSLIAADSDDVVNNALHQNINPVVPKQMWTVSIWRPTRLINHP